MFIIIMQFSYTHVNTFHADMYDSSLCMYACNFHVLVFVINIHLYYSSYMSLFMLFHMYAHVHKSIIIHECYSLCVFMPFPFVCLVNLFITLAYHCLYLYMCIHVLYMCS